MISVKRVYAGDGYRYLLRGIADGEDLPGASAVTSYYTQEGNPPGQWVGSGLTGLGDGAGVEPGSRVSERQLERMFRDGVDPLTGHPLGRRFRTAIPWRERADTRIEGLSAHLTSDERAAAVTEIEAEERSRPSFKPVAGFDVTFSPPKSVSVLWGLADQGVREQIYEAHQAAIRDVLSVVERDVARTRVGANGVAQVPTRGVVAASFDHWDSRSGDPQLHTHVLVLNRVQGAADGRWRTLDSRGALYPSVVALSELYDNLLADHITARVGIGWENRGTRHKAKNTSWELQAVPAELISAFSTRSADIEAEKDRLVDAYRQQHGRSPTDRTIIQLRQIATLATRPGKEVRSLAELTEHWRQRAAVLLGQEPARWVSDQTRFAANGQPSQQSWRVDDLAATGALGELAAAAFTELATERSTWTEWNVRAAVARAAMVVRMSDADERDRLIAMVAEQVVAMSVDLTPPEPAFTPSTFRGADGRSAFAPPRTFTSAGVLAAEDRLLAAARSRTAPVLGLATVHDVTTTPTPAGISLTDDQADALYRIAVSARRVDVLLGPAGSGKTTALEALRRGWESEHGAGSVVGLAPSAAAADVLAESLRIETDNTAKWLHEARRNTHRAAELRHLRTALSRLARDDPRWRDSLNQATAVWPEAARWRQAAGHDGSSARTGARLAAQVRNRATALAREIDRWRFTAGQLVIVDEASLAGTLALDAITTQAETAGAKVLLVGDHAQLSAVDAGGAFGMLIREYDGDLVPELTALHRFRAQWERAATRRLRDGDTSVLRLYQEQDRLHDGETQDVIDAAYQAWLADETAGHTSLLIAASGDTVRDLAVRARADRVAAGDVEADGVVLHDGSLAGRGDRIITRHNDRRLTIGRSWVKNGDTWTVQRRHRDGSLTIQRHRSTGTITLPAAYVRRHVELAYATTAHRAQGASVDTTHVLVTGTSMFREVFYVAMTRGRDANHAYVDITTAPDEQHLNDDTQPTALTVLSAVLQRRAAPQSAHQTAAELRDQVASFGQLADEYTTLAADAASERTAHILAGCPLPAGTGDPSVPPAFPALAAAVQHAEATGIDVTSILPWLAARRELDTADDPIAILHHRLTRHVERAAAHATNHHRLIAGLIPAATNITDPDLRRALDERAHLLEHRAATLAQHAIDTGADWLTDLGPIPTQPADRRIWMECVATIAAYRERHDIVAPEPLGRGPHELAGTDVRHAVLALRRAQSRAGLFNITAPRSGPTIAHGSMIGQSLSPR